MRTTCQKIAWSKESHTTARKIRATSKRKYSSIRWRKWWRIRTWSVTWLSKIFRACWISWYSRPSAPFFKVSSLPKCRSHSVKSSSRWHSRAFSYMVWTLHTSHQWVGVSCWYTDFQTSYKSSSPIKRPCKKLWWLPLVRTWWTKIQWAWWVKTSTRSSRLRRRTSRSSTGNSPSTTSRMPLSTSIVEKLQKALNEHQ